METVQKLKFSLFAHISFTKWSSYVCKTIQHFRQPWIVKNILRWGVSIYIITVKIHCLEMLVQKHTDLDSLNNQSVCRFGAHSDFLARYTIKMRKWIKKNNTFLTIRSMEKYCTYECIFKTADIDKTDSSSVVYSLFCVPCAVCLTYAVGFVSIGNTLENPICFFFFN